MSGGNAVTQNGAVVEQRLSLWRQDRQVGDVGGITGQVSGPYVGEGASPFSISDEGGIGLQFNDAPTTGDYNSLGFGHNAGGQPVMVINGVEHVLPAGAASVTLGSGQVLGNNTLISSTGTAVAGVIYDSTNSYYKAGNALFPEYATQTATTATSGLGSPTITVTSASGIGEGDLIGAAYVPFGTYVVAIVGTTVTMSANATATNGIPVATTFGQNRFSAQNSVLTNTLAAQVGQFGSAARGHTTWLGQVSPALDLSWSSVYSISPIGQTAVTAATRSSDNFAPASNTIASLVYCFADQAAYEIFTWGTYAESFLDPDAVQSIHLQYEGSLVNQWAISADETPYNINPTVAAINMRLDNGKGIASEVATCALDIVNNGGTYRSGIVFDVDAFDYTDLRDYAPALALAAKQSVSWYTTAGGVPSWSVWADGGTPTTFHMTDVFNDEDFIRIDPTSGILVLGEDGVRTLMRGPLQLKEYTVATLPAAVPALKGCYACVNDATAPTYNGALVGGGAVSVPVYCDGAAWTSH